MRLALDMWWLSRPPMFKAVLVTVYYFVSLIVIWKS